MPVTGARPITLSGDVWELWGSGTPVGESGADRGEGSSYRDLSDGTLWMKIGPADTDWNVLTGGGGSGGGTPGTIPKWITATVLGNSLLSESGSTVTANASFTVNTNLSVLGNTTLGNATSDTVTIAGSLAVDTSVLTVNPTTNRVGINTALASTVLDLDVTGQFGIKPSGGYPTVLSDGVGGRFYAVHQTGDWGFVIGRAANDNGSANLTLYHTRNADASVRTALVNGDRIGRITYQGATATAGTVIIGASVMAVVNGTVSSGNLPTELRIYTTNAGDADDGDYKWVWTPDGHYVPFSTAAALNLGSTTQRPATVFGVLANFSGVATLTGGYASGAASTQTGNLTFTSGNLVLGTNSITMTGSIATTGSRVTKGWFTDLEVTNAIVGSITGNAATATALQTTRTLWGQNFDGTANVTGSLTSVGDITGTAGVTLTATAATLALVATGANVITFTTNSTLRGTVTSAGVLDWVGTISAATGTFTNFSGTMTSGAVPASLVTAGTFGAGAYTFPARLTVTSQLLVGTTTAATGTPEVDVVGGGGPHLVVSDVITNTVDKVGRIGARHYTNSEEPIAFLVSLSSSAATSVSLGGGSAQFNAATVVRIYTAADNVTTTGTIRASWDSSGVFAQVGNATIGGTLGVTGAVTGGTYNGQTIANASVFVTSASAPLLIGTTRVTSPLLGTTTATDVVFDRNSVTQLTLGSLLATFAGAVTVTGTLTARGAVIVGSASAGTNAAISRSINDGELRINGGSGSGGFVTVYGTSHSSLAGDISFGSSINQRASWDESALRWTFLQSFIISGVATGTFVVNESGVDFDTRIAGDTLANLFFLDASTDRIGINTATPAYLLDVNGDCNATAYRVGGTAGASFSGAITNLTVVNGIVTAAS